MSKSLIKEPHQVLITAGGSPIVVLKSEEFLEHGDLIIGPENQLWNVKIEKDERLYVMVKRNEESKIIYGHTTLPYSRKRLRE